LCISPLFKKSLAYAYKLKPDAIYILSAKHHLLELDSVIEPYDVTLNKMKKNDRLNWGKKVIELLKWKVDLESDRFIILAGNNYILRFLLTSLSYLKMVFISSLRKVKALEKWTE